ncbi:tetraacyldisaccharide 4'-kinase [Oxalicibacterium faecigallinarum]|uniref:Tetraacyldisaccharide 4'-kinase n=1 Tax=Oxalicibacterium faecigallinarum TaxID=573741 RepID=A0A8J3AWI5_9BURK|nr:tetraacyldisaccharide 4'-kinase [Oxalicibacterium faecigallinarum]GGI20882.1 tetraacyldisaccharide 4'-kinase [Oxalicibacterium faecigallinarum]
MARRHSRLENFLTRSWMQRGLFAHAMLPLSCLFHHLANSRRRSYLDHPEKRQRLPVPVIVVGNIFVGGTGKTPLTIWLVHTLREAGFHPGVISRGYGADNSLVKNVTTLSSPQDVGDEPLLIAQRAQCPLVVGRDRVAAGLALLAAHPQVDVIISDDGLQHYRLVRDIEIVLFDQRGIGNGWLLPAGPLREPASRQGDFTVVNGGLPAPGVAADAIAMHLRADQVEQLSDPAQTRPLTSFAGIASLLAAAGIGNPARFFNMLREAGLQFETMALPDHHDFANNPFADSTAEIILITEKDAVKCRQHETLKNDPRIWVVPVTAQIDGAFAERIVEKLRGHSIA